MLHHILNALGAVGNALDLPASSFRDYLGGQDPWDQWKTPLTDQNRMSGRDLLRHHGLIGQHDTWGNFAGGLATEALTDPLNIISGIRGLALLRSRKAATEAAHAARASHAVAMAKAAEHNEHAAAMMRAGHLTAEQAAETSLPNKYWLSNSGKDDIHSAIQQARIDHNTRMNNSLGNGYVEPEHFDQYAPRLHELSDPSKVREDSFPVRLLSKNPLMAWGPMTEDALHNIAAHAKDAVELAIPEMAMGGVRKEHIKRAQKLTTLKKAVKSLPSYQEHAMFDGPIPTGSHVVEAIHSQSGRPHTVLRKAGYDAIDHDPIITGTRILDPSIIHPWDLAPTPMPVPSAPSIRKLRPISPLVAQAIGRHIISRGGHDQ